VVHFMLDVLDLLAQKLSQMLATFRVRGVHGCVTGLGIVLWLGHRS
jgi:hypothetical protein